MIRTIKDFLILTDHINDNWDSITLVSQLFNDFGTPQDSVDFVDCSFSDNQTECMILFSFSKSKPLGEILKCLGKRITRLSDYEFSIQELDNSFPDKYYILIYGKQ